ncbi:DUF6095 family protein [Flavobacterium myungsuense]|uniref:DUF6095 family protein n=1 Tax=Flavobacterium myungsuense TaxID=651823 RepID=A0ABW3J3Z8_9FLAO
MAKNQKVLAKGIRFLTLSLPLLFIGPSVIYNAFMNKNNVWHYLVLAIGIIVCFAAVYFIFKGLKTIVDGLFDS